MSLKGLREVQGRNLVFQRAEALLREAVDKTRHGVSSGDFVAGFVGLTEARVRHVAFERKVHEVCLGGDGLLPDARRKMLTACAQMSCATEGFRYAIAMVNGHKANHPAMPLQLILHAVAQYQSTEKHEVGTVAALLRRCAGEVAAHPLLYDVSHHVMLLRACVNASCALEEVARLDAFYARGGFGLLLTGAEAAALVTNIFRSGNGKCFSRLSRIVQQNAGMMDQMRVAAALFRKDASSLQHTITNLLRSILNQPTPKEITVSVRIWFVNIVLENIEGFRSTAKRIGMDVARRFSVESVEGLGGAVALKEAEVVATLVKNVRRLAPVRSDAEFLQLVTRLAETALRGVDPKTVQRSSSKSAARFLSEVQQLHSSLTGGGGAVPALHRLAESILNEVQFRLLDATSLAAVSLICKSAPKISLHMPSTMLSWIVQNPACLAKAPVAVNFLQWIGGSTQHRFAEVLQKQCLEVLGKWSETLQGGSTMELFFYMKALTSVYVAFKGTVLSVLQREVLSDICMAILVSLFGASGREAGEVQCRSLGISCAVLKSILRTTDRYSDAHIESVRASLERCVPYSASRLDASQTVDLFHLCFDPEHPLSFTHENTEKALLLTVFDRMQKNEIPFAYSLRMLSIISRGIGGSRGRENMETFLKHFASAVNAEGVLSGGDAVDAVIALGAVHCTNVVLVERVVVGLQRLTEKYVPTGDVVKALVSLREMRAGGASARSLVLLYADDFNLSEAVSGLHSCAVLNSANSALWAQIGSRIVDSAADLTASDVFAVATAAQASALVHAPLRTALQHRIAEIRAADKVPASMHNFFVEYCEEEEGEEEGVNNGLVSH